MTSLELKIADVLDQLVAGHLDRAVAIGKLADMVERARRDENYRPFPPPSDPWADIF